MNLMLGKFKAPSAGIYFFSFTGLARYPVASSASRFRFGLNLNGVLIGRGQVVEGNTVADQLSPITFQSTLNLKKNDQVWIVINHCCDSSYYLFDDSDHAPHPFHGFHVGGGNNCFALKIFNWKKLLNGREIHLTNDLIDLLRNGCMSLSNLK